MLKIKLIKYNLVCFLFLSILSCRSSTLVGSWEFIENYNAEISAIDSIKFKKNHSKYGTGVLHFNADKTFVSMDLKGFYRKEKNILKMKYENDKDTVSMKISYFDKNHLLLSSKSEKPITWYYKKQKK